MGVLSLRYDGCMINLSGGEVARILAVSKKSKEALVFMFGEDSEVRVQNDFESIRVILDSRDNVSDDDQVIRVHPSVFDGIASTKDGVSISGTQVSSGRKKITTSVLEPSYNESLFKVMEEKGFSDPVTLDSDELKIINAGTQFANRSSTLGGVACFMYHDGLVFVALDGYKIFLHRINDIVAPEQKIMVQSESIESIAALCQTGEVDIMFGNETNLIAARNSFYEYIAPLSAKAPNKYESFGLSHGENPFTSVDMSEISDFMKSTSVIGDNSMAVVLDIDPEDETLSLSATGRNGEEIGMDIRLDSVVENVDDGQHMSASVSASMLQAAASLFRGVATLWMDRRTLSFSDDTSTVHIVRRRV